MLTTPTQAPGTAPALTGLISLHRTHASRHPRCPPVRQLCPAPPEPVSPLHSVLGGQREKTRIHPPSSQENELRKPTQAVMIKLTFIKQLLYAQKQRGAWPAAKAWCPRPPLMCPSPATRASSAGLGSGEPLAPSQQTAARAGPSLQAARQLWGRCGSWGCCPSPPQAPWQSHVPYGSPTSTGQPSPPALKRFGRRRRNHQGAQP